MPFKGDRIIPSLSSCSNWDKTGVGVGMGVGVGGGVGSGSNVGVAAGGLVGVSSVATTTSSVAPPLHADKERDVAIRESETRTNRDLFPLGGKLKEFITD